AFIEKWKTYAKAKNLPNADTVVTNDPMEATYIGIHMWKQAVEQAKATDVDAVIDALGGQTFEAPNGFTIQMDKTNHHLHKPVYIGEINEDGQFNIVWKTEGPIRAQPWSPFIEGNESKQNQQSHGSAMGLTILSTLLRRMALALVLMLAPGTAPALAADSAALDIALLAPLAGGDTEAKLRVIAQLGQMPDQRVTQILEALRSGRLRGTSSGELFIIEADQTAVDAVTGETRSLPPDANSIMINNRLRRAIAGALAVSQLFSERSGERLAAAQAVQRGSDPAMLPAVEQALATETDPQVRQALGVARAVLQLKQTDHTARISAIKTLGDSGDGAFRSML